MRPNRLIRVQREYTVIGNKSIYLKVIYHDMNLSFFILLKVN